MNDVLLFFTSYALNAVWQVAVLGAVGHVLCRALERVGPEVQHKLWVAVLVLATLIPATPFLRGLVFKEAQIASDASQSTAQAVKLEELVVAGSDLVVPPAVIPVVGGTYGLLLFFFAVRLCCLVSRTRALLRNAAPLHLESERARLWERSRSRFSVPGAALMSSDAVPVPVTATLWRSAVLLPAGARDGYSDTEFLAAVGHECAHVARHDFWKNLAYEIVRLLIAFHPVAWFIKSRIAQTREMICDRLAAERLLTPRSYAVSLLQLAADAPPAAQAVPAHALGIFDSNALEARIMNLSSAKPAVSLMRRTALATAAIVVLAACTSAAGLLTQSVKAKTAESSAGNGKSATTKRELSCTYYLPDGKAHPGTCGFDKKNKKSYLCYSNVDPKLSQTQIGCESKLLPR